MNPDQDEVTRAFSETFAVARPGGSKLYLISPQDVGGSFPDRLKAALEPGLTTAFQLRVKDVDEHELARLAEPLQRICAEADVAFIVNDNMGLAKRIGADGVHLGQSDGDIREARALLGPSAQIGKTCHDSRHLAMEAGEAGADYVAFGAFYPTTTKPSDYRPDPSILSWWSTLFEIPCVAIGGVTATNATPLVEAGADFLAVCQGVWGKEDPAAAVAAFEGFLSGSPGRPST
jgi:thiamine-phosphate pyrophosphorylase